MAASLPCLSCPLTGGAGDLERGGVLSSQSSSSIAIDGLFIARSALGAASVARYPIGNANRSDGSSCSSSEVASVLLEVTRVSGPPYALRIPRFGAPMALATASASCCVACIDASSAALLSCRCLPPTVWACSTMLLYRLLPVSCCRFFFFLSRLDEGRTTITGTGECCRQYFETEPGSSPCTPPKLRPLVPTTKAEGS